MTSYLPETAKQALEAYWGALAHARRLKAENGLSEVGSGAQRRADWFLGNALEVMAFEAEELLALEEIYKN